MKRSPIAFALLPCVVTVAHAATSLPVGPFTFATASQYDSNFKEGANGALIADTGYIRVVSGADTVGVGSALYDTGVTPGTGGNGGTGGTNANNDLSDFSVSSLIQFQNRGQQSTAGYFLRMNDAGTAGYLATVTFFNSSGTLSLRFDLFKNVGIDYNPATTTIATPSGAIYSEVLAFSTSAAANFRFTVTAAGSLISYHLANAGGTASVSGSHNDTGTTVLTGQTGIFLRAQSQAATSTSRMDDFTITEPIPEPGAIMLLTGSLAPLACRRRRK